MPLTIKEFLTILKTLLDPTPVNKTSSEWQSILNILISSIQHLSHKIRHQQGNDTRKVIPAFTTVNRRLESIYKELKSINSASLKNKLWEYLYLCQILLQFREAIASASGNNTIFHYFEEIYKTIVETFTALLKLKAFEEYKNHETIESLVDSFTFLPNIYIFLELRREIVEPEARALNLEALYLVNNIAHTAQVSGRFFKELFNYLNKSSQTSINSLVSVFNDTTNNLTIENTLNNKLTILAVERIIIYQNPNESKKIIAHLDTLHKLKWNDFLLILRSDSDQLKKLAAKFNEYTSTSDENVLSGASNDQQNENSFRNIMQSIDLNGTPDDFVMSLATHLPKHTEKLFGIIEKPYINFIAKYFTPEEIVYTRELVKKICRLYITLKPYTPKSLKTLVLLYKHTFNKFSHLDQELFAVIFKHRYQLKTKDTAIFLHSYFMSAKEKDNIDNRMINFYKEVKTGIEDKLTTLNEEEKAKFETILSSLDQCLPPSLFSIESNDPVPKNRINAASKTDYLKIFISRFNNDFITNEYTTCEQLAHLAQGMNACRQIINILKSDNEATIDDATLTSYYKKFIENFTHRDFCFDGDFDQKKFCKLVKELSKNPNLNALFELGNSFGNFSINILNEIHLLKKEDLIDPTLDTPNNFNFIFFENLLVKLIKVFSSETVINHRIHEHALIQQCLNPIKNFLKDPNIKNFFEEYPMLFTIKQKSFNNEYSFYSTMDDQLIRPTQRLTKYPLIIRNCIEDFNSHCAQKELTIPVTIENLLQQLQQTVKAIGAAADTLKRTDSVKLITPPITPIKILNHIEPASKEDKDITINATNSTCNTSSDNFISSAVNSHNAKIGNTINSLPEFGLYNFAKLHSYYTDNLKNCDTEHLSIEKTKLSTDSNNDVYEYNKNFINPIEVLIEKIKLFFTAEENFCQQIKNLVDSMGAISKPFFINSSYTALTELVSHYKNFSINLFDHQIIFLQLTKQYDFQTLKKNLIRTPLNKGNHELLSAAINHILKKEEVITETIKKTSEDDYLFFVFISHLSSHIETLKSANNHLAKKTDSNLQLLKTYPSKNWVNFFSLFIKNLHKIFLSSLFIDRITINLNYINENYAAVAKDYPEYNIDIALIHNHLNSYYTNLKNVFDAYIKCNNFFADFISEYKNQEINKQKKPNRFYDLLSIHIDSNDPIYQPATETEIQEITNRFKQLLKVISSFNQTKLGITTKSPLKRQLSLESNLGNLFLNSPKPKFATTRSRSKSITLPENNMQNPGKNTSSQETEVALESKTEDTLVLPPTSSPK